MHFIRKQYLGILFTSISITLSAATVVKVVPMASDTSLKVEIHLSVKAGEKVTLQGSINPVKGQNELWQGNWGTYTFQQNADTVIIVRVNNLKPRLWTPSTPELYQLKVAANNVTTSVRLGFRKFEKRDGVFFLNGRPIFLRGNAINPPKRGIPEKLEESKDFARDYVRYLKSLNINIIRIQANQDWLDVCDEEGMMIFSGRYGQPAGGNASAPPTDLQVSLKSYKEKELGAFTSHPSVMIYILSNEMPYKGKVGDLYRDFLSKMYQNLRDWDDTKLFICNAGYGLGRSADIYDVHRYWGWYYNTFLTYLNMRDMDMWQNAGKPQPITFTECVGNYTGIDGRYNLCSKTKQPSSQACWTGHLPENQQAEAALANQAFVLKNSTEMFRRLRNHNKRLAGIMPFTILFYHWDDIKSFDEMGPKPAAIQYKTSYQPILLSWESWHSQVYAGSRLPVVAHVVNDDDEGADLKDAQVEWSLERESTIYLTGKFSLPLIPYYQTFEHSVSLNLPEDLPTGKYKLRGIIRSGNNALSQNECDVFIAGKDWKRAVSSKKIYVHDPTGKTMSAISRLGYASISLTDLKKLSTRALLIIGEDSWDQTLDDQKTLLQKFIRQGGRILCMRQKPETFNTEWLPAKIELLKASNNSPEYLSPSFAYADGMNINMERPYHPVFKDLTPDHFKLWSDYTNFDESQPGFPSIYPVSQGYLVDGSNLSHVAILANYSRGLAACGLSEFFSGKGSVLLSGFDMTGRIGIDPISDRFLGNMIEYMAKTEDHPVHVYVKDSIIWGDYASEKGIVTCINNGLMVNTIPIIPSDQLTKYPLQVDDFGYQFAGSYGGWNTKPGIQYVPNGRRAVAPFGFLMGGSIVIKKGTTTGEGFFYAALAPNKKTMYTLFENPVEVPLQMTIVINDNQMQDVVIGPKQKITIKSTITLSDNSIKVLFKGDRRLVLLKTRFE